MADLKQEVEQNIARYAGAVLVNRALCDSRDMLKPSARMLLYSQIETSKNLPSKPYLKCARIVGDALGHWYTHGDASCYSIYARLAKPFAMRYVLEDFHGNYGTLKATDNEAASRYTEIRLSELGYSLFDDIEKDTIEDWEQNFDETEEYPRVATSKGFYNIVNGSQGIGYGAASSIPQFNLREVNEALIKLLWNPDIDAHEIICMPDYATGAILINKNEVIESLINGTGRACKLRSVVEYDKTRRALKVTEIPYGVYTDTIRQQIKQLVDENENIGIDGYNDMSARDADIEIYLNKKTNPDKILKLLYKETSLQSYAGINMTMLENGRIPKVFTWKEALQSYLTHQISVYTKGFNFDLNKIKSRLHIVDGLIRAISILDEVITLVRGAADSKNASLGLQQSFNFTEIQAKAILDIKLAKLTHLDINKLEQERNDLLLQKGKLEEILQNEDKLKAEIEKDLRAVADKYGDARRTKIMNLCADDTDEPVEVKMLQVSLTNQNNLFVSETSTLYSQRRGGVGTKIKTNDGEYIISTINIQSNDTLLLFSKKGNYYHCKASQLLIDKNYIGSLVSFNEEDDICAITSLSKNNENPYIIFVTKNGIIKKSNISEYNITRNICCKAIALDDTDEIKSVIFTKNDKLGILTFNGNFVIINTEDLRDTSRISRGVIGIKLNENDFVVSSKIISNEKRFITISANGLAKQTNSNEFTVQGRNTKGTKIQKLTDGDSMVDFCPIMDEKQISIISNHSIIKIDINEIPLYTKGAQGVKSIKLSNNDKIVKIVAN